MIGEDGVAVTDLMPAGKILISGEYWNAVCTGEVPRGTAVRVLELNGLLLRVAPVQETATED